mmetsp:Transcript_16102/g.23696  ORF Transcript_16102/g.23696 Transcript_16102/m.23696 type:complete len:236 (-) Transcript_16102:43-750(-)
MNSTTPDYLLDDKIANTRSQLIHVKKAREEERQRFTENQSILAQRQHFYHQELDRLQQPKVSLAPYYWRVMNGRSCIGESPYVISRETELCQALHQVEITTNQWRIVVKHHDNMMQTLKKKLGEETKRSEDLEEELLRAIKFSSIDMAGIIVENRAILEGQHKQIACLSGESTNTEDASKSMYDELGHDLSTGSITPNSLRVRKWDDRENRRVNMERRIIEVGSYFGNLQTAEAA